MRVEQVGNATLYLANCLDVFPLLEVESIDAIVTDPPYAKQFDYVWDILADQTPRLLKSGGHLLTLCGHYQLPRVMEALSRNLNYHWLCILRNAGGITPIMHGYGVKVNFKPCLWYTKGKRAKHLIMDDDLARGGIKWSKELHKWNQPVVFGPIVKLVSEGGIVLDPFMGSGTNGVACIQTGRKFIGVEISLDYFQTAVDRITAAWSQLRLPLEEAEETK